MVSTRLVTCSCIGVLAVLVLVLVLLLWPHDYDSLAATAAQREALKCDRQYGNNHVTIAGTNTICFYGLINREARGRFFALPINNGDTVILKSLGGSVEDALDIAEVFEQKHLVAVVNGYCISSCANYLFPAAAAKIVLDGGVVGFHGHPPDELDVKQWTYIGPPTQREAAFAETVTGWQRLLSRQAAFFTRIGVNPNLIRDYPLHTLPALFPQATAVWEFGPNTLRDKYGVTNIIYFQTPDHAGLRTRMRSYIFGLPCRSMTRDVWMCTGGLL